MRLVLDRKTAECMIHFWLSLITKWTVSVNNINVNCQCLQNDHHVFYCDRNTNVLYDMKRHDDTTHC